MTRLNSNLIKAAALLAFCVLAYYSSSLHRWMVVGRYVRSDGKYSETLFLRQTGELTQLITNGAGGSWMAESRWAVYGANGINVFGLQMTRDPVTSQILNPPRYQSHAIMGYSRGKLYVSDWDDSYPVYTRVER